MRCSLMLLAVIGLAGCGTTKVVVEHRVETYTVTETRTVTRAGAPSPTVYVEQEGRLSYKPDVLGLGASSAIERIRWQSYGGAVAIGRGVWGKNDCTPNCASGKITSVPVTVKLMARELCQGVVAYSQWSLIGAGFDPTPDALAQIQSPCRS
jgi:hypothetical protein